MPAVMTMGGARAFSCVRGKTKTKVKARGRGCTQTLECTHKGATGWTIKKGSRRCSR